MNERTPLPEDEDKRLGILFRELDAPIPDDGFTGHTMQRVGRVARRRAIALSLAGATGAAFAAAPLLTLLNAAGREVSTTASRWHELSGLLDRPVLLGAGLLILLGPAVWRWLEE